MKHTITIITAVLAAVSISFAEHHAHGDKAMKAEKNIAEIASKHGSFDTLVALLSQAELVEALTAEGPFTVFAPTDKAFAKLPKAVVTDLMKEESADKLKTILLSHVVSAKVPASAVETGKVKTLSGEKINVKVKEGKVMVGGAKVVQTDVMASNGIIHVIDSVIIPGESGEMAKKDKGYGKKKATMGY
jgi:uncharacterized surface protein with fasciclin (FAS1) repeats